jgi:hypothetical protein
MVTQNQMQMQTIATTDLISIDIYQSLPIQNRPIPGRLIYTDGKGKLFQLNGDGTFDEL